MYWNDKVVWQEGMFLRAQHFQQADRYQQSQLRASTRALRAFPWGVTTCAVNRDLLSTGRFALSLAEGLLDDGTPFSLPHDVALPPPLEPPEGTRNARVFLAVPLAQDGTLEVAAAGSGPESTQARYTLQGFDAYDTHSDSTISAEIGVGRLRLRYLLETEELAGYARVAVARILEVQSDRRVVLDEEFVPPCLRVSASSVLSAYLIEATGMMDQRAAVVAGRLGQPGVRGTGDFINHFVLQTLNRWRTLFAHWAEVGFVHPESFYGAFVSLVGELATFTFADKLPRSVSTYRHDDLQGTFSPLMSELRRAMAAVIETNVWQLTVKDAGKGLRGAVITDKGLLKDAQFVLVVAADISGDELRRTFRNKVKIGPVERVEEMRKDARGFIDLSALAVAPPQLPFRAGAAYFQLDSSSRNWSLMANSAAFVIDVQDEDPGTRLELWAIRS